MPTRLGLLAALLTLVGALLALGGTASAATAPTTPTAAPDIGTVATSLATDPLYVSTAPGTPHVAGGDVRGALPADVYVAVLPASAANQVGGEVAALPGAILGRLTRPGTVLVLAGRDLEGASRTQSFDRLQTVLSDARNRLAAGAAPAQSLVLAARGLDGNGQLSDPPAPSRAGSPSGGGLLYAILGLVVAAILAIPILLRRARNAPPTPPPTVLRDRVEVDAYGHIVRRVTAKELAAEQERSGGNHPD
jgi:hypothetical protein